MSSKRLIRRALAVLVLAIATVTLASSGASLSAMNVNSIYNVQANGAVGNGSADDSAAEQAAIDAACSASSVGAPATVYWPTPSNLYSTCSPLFVHCSGLRLLGAGLGTSIGGSGHSQAIQLSSSCPATSGPAFVFQGYGMTGVAIGAPLIAGSTGSASFDGTAKYYVNLNDALLAPSNTITLNGSSAFTVDLYEKPASAANQVFAVSKGRKAEYLPETSAFGVFFQGGRFQAKANISGTTYTLTDTTTTPTIGTLYDHQLTFASNELRLFTNGALVASQAATGTLTLPYWEVVTVGADAGDWPDGSSQYSAADGLIDGVQISNTARHTSTFTPCNCEPTPDTHTAVAWAPGINLHMLTRLSYGVGPSEWSYVRRTVEPNGGGEGPNSVTGIEMDGISYYGRYGSFGIVGQGFTNGNIRHSQFVNMEYGPYLFDDDYENTIDGDYFAASQIPLYVGGGSGLLHVTGGTTLQ